MLLLKTRIDLERAESGLVSVEKVTLLRSGSSALRKGALAVCLSGGCSDILPLAVLLPLFFRFFVKLRSEIIKYKILRKLH